MTVPDAEYSQTGNYHEFYRGKRGYVPSRWLEVLLDDDRVSLGTNDSADGSFDLNMNDARILRDILTEHIARQDRKPA